MSEKINLTKKLNAFLDRWFDSLPFEGLYDIFGISLEDIGDDQELIIELDKMHEAWNKTSMNGKLYWFDFLYDLYKDYTIELDGPFNF